MKASNSISALVWLVVAAAGAVLTAVVLSLAGPLWAVLVAVASLLAATLAAASVRMAAQWEQAVVLRLGKFQRLAGPGLFFIIPVVDQVAYLVDRRTITTPFRAEKTLTLDTVPVDVDAVLFWRVIDTQRAALEVENYPVAVAWSAQTALRDIIGRSSLAQILSERRTIDEQMREVIDQRTGPWGISVLSVEIRDVRIPPELQAAMSRQAQAERERQARVILAQSEVQIAEKFAEAAREYAQNPTALHLRAMNMLYEGLKERGALMIVPSSALDSMSLGALSGLASLGQQARAESPQPH